LRDRGYGVYWLDVDEAWAQEGCCASRRRLLRPIDPGRGLIDWHPWWEVANTPKWPDRELPAGAAAQDHGLNAPLAKKSYREDDIVKAMASSMQTPPVLCN